MATSDAAVVGYKTYTCPHAAQCGGCEWLSVPYPIQLSRKRAALGELFAPFGRDVDDIVGMDEPVAYRHKIMTPYAPGKGGKPRHGMYRRGTHDLIGMRTCLVEHKAGRPILESIAELAQGFRIPAYDENTGKGLLRHAIVRVSRVTGQVMVTLVVNRKEFPRKRAFVAALRKRYPSIESVSFNVNTRRTNAVLGPLSMTAYGQGWIEDELCGCTFRIPADAFYQTNPAQTERLYQIAIDMARLREGDRVLDAYCGIGTIGIIAARQMRIDLVGVESVESAVCIARENARINRVRNASFVCADAGEHLAKADATFDVVILDPPRAGASEEFLGSLLAATPRRIVYISCNPVTQVRDIERLSSAYRVARLVGVDMFPHTKHLESVALLERRCRGRGERKGNRNSRPVRSQSPVQFSLHSRDKSCYISFSRVRRDSARRDDALARKVTDDGSTQAQDRQDEDPFSSFLQRRLQDGTPFRMPAVRRGQASAHHLPELWLLQGP